jgi:conserved hypothetical protein
MSGLEISRIDIKNFGCYKDYNQHRSSGIESDFNKERVNIFYGRNYSGKSTYSKIFQSIELRKLPEKYGDIDFEIKLENNNIIKSKDVGNQDLPIDCRVFNQKFIDDNINLHSDNKLNSFQVTIGNDNNESLKRIQEIELNELNPILKDLERVNSEIANLDSQYKENKNILDDKLKATAAFVKNKKNPSVIMNPRYDIRDIKNEFENYVSMFPIVSKDDEELKIRFDRAKMQILEENISMPKKIDLNEFDNDFNLQEINLLLSKTISVSKILDEYKNNPEKMNWIKCGVDIHGKNPEKCVFCGNSIDGHLIQNLEIAFSDELVTLESNLEEKNNYVKSEIEKLEKVPKIEAEDYFRTDSLKIKRINQDIENEFKNRLNVLKLIESKIAEKQRDIFSKVEIEMKESSWGSFSEIQDEIDLLYENTIDRIEQFEELRQESINFLRWYYIAEKLPVSEYQMLSQKVDNLRGDLQTKKNEREKLEGEESKYKNIISELESKLKSEKEAVKRINQILKNSLAHSEISLESSDSGDEIYYKVTRNKENAYNLSEGEKSLIAFAYYISRLDSLSNEEKSKTILFIDDPISSLDENNIFYIYNLIFCLLEKKEFLQYFLSTHNLDFLKYTNRFSSKKDYYLIEKIKESENEPSKSYIKKLPSHMSSKVTEFVFLFEQIYKVATEDETEDNFSVFYNFPNNGRKFIEILLYFKYPDYHTRNDVKIRNFFGEENAPFIQRINNEYSHGEDRFDRTRHPINTSEFKHDAEIILKTLYKKDPDQFNAFLANNELVMPSFLNN